MAQTLTVRVALSVLVALTIGCASTPRSNEPRKLTTQEAAATHKIFKDVSKERLMAAAQAVLVPLGTNGGMFEPELIYTPTGLRVSRHWMIFGVIFVSEGVDYWEISFHPAAEGVEVSLQLLLTSITERGRPPRGAAIYDLFWARLGYVLGLNDRWVTCADAKRGAQYGIGSGELEPLCGFFRGDPVPERLGPTEVQSPTIKPDARHPTRKQWLAATSRSYRGLESRRVLDAARRVLELADSRRFHMERGTDFLFARRDWTIFYLIGGSEGSEEWEVRTYDTKEGLIVWVYVTERHSGTLFLLPGGGFRAVELDDGDKAQPSFGAGPYRKVATAPEQDHGTGYRTLKGRSTTTVFGTALYELFFARLEFLLGMRDDWMTCRQSDDRVSHKFATGDNSALCSHVSDDSKSPVR